MNAVRKVLDQMRREPANVRFADLSRQWKNWRTWNMNVDHYTYRVTWSPEDGEHVGLCAEFPSLSWLAQSPEAALKGIRRVVAEAVADMRAGGEAVPAPLAERHYSGEFRVRIPPESPRRFPPPAPRCKCGPSNCDDPPSPAPRGFMSPRTNTRNAGSSHRALRPIRPAAAAAERRTRDRYRTRAAHRRVPAIRTEPAAPRLNASTERECARPPAGRAHRAARQGIDRVRIAWSWP